MLAASPQGAVDIAGPKCAGITVGHISYLLGLRVRRSRFLLLVVVGGCAPGVSGSPEASSSPVSGMPSPKRPSLSLPEVAVPTGPVCHIRCGDR